MNAPFRIIDLFAGAGGLTLGFTSVPTRDGSAAFETVWANDFNKDAVATYNANFGGHCTHGDLVEILAADSFVVPEADVVIGGPPCQGFSLLNKNRDGDPRKQLWRPFMEVVVRSNARMFVMENVRQLVTSPEFDDIKAEAERLGFQVMPRVLCAADYGVPQERYRSIIVGFRDAHPATAFPPKRTHISQAAARAGGSMFSEYVPEVRAWRTVAEVISDLPRPLGSEIRNEAPPLDLHFGRSPTEVSIRRYRAVPPGGNRFDLYRNAPELTPQCWVRKKSGGTDLFGRLWWDRPSVTIRTEFFKPEKGRYLHPQQDRPITHREAARLQSFPDGFRFVGSKIEIARQIGNAVPPLLAEAIARSVYVLLTGRSERVQTTSVHERPGVFDWHWNGRQAEPNSTIRTHVAGPFEGDGGGIASTIASPPAGLSVPTS